MEKMLGGAYSQEVFDAGLTTEKADLVGASVPFRLAEKVNKAAWDQIQIDEAPFYKRLTDAGFTVDFGPDGTGISMKFQRTSSGYYVDVGASDMVADGRIKVRSGVSIERIVEDGMILSDGSHVQADRIIYATGFGDMKQWVARLINPEVAERIGKTWGYGSGFPGDPGPWEGEMKNLWKPTPEPGLWFMAGNLAMARSYSRYLGLQLKARFEGLPVEPYVAG
jgi:putative flavoprotein involved in K+ transport